MFQKQVYSRGAKPVPETTCPLTVSILVNYTAEQVLEFNKLRLDTASSEGNTMAAAIFDIKNRNILAPNMASLSATAGGSE